MPLRLYSRRANARRTHHHGAGHETILTGFGLERVGGKPDRTTWIEERMKPQWIVPSYRRDLRREVDLIEEIVRVHGLDRVAEPHRRLGRAVRRRYRQGEYDFQIEPQAPVWPGWGSRKPGARRSCVTIPSRAACPLKNPLNEENAVLRGTLLPGLLAAAGRNARQSVADLRLFEIGR